MKTQEQWEIALKAGKHSEATLKKMQENLENKTNKGVIAFSLGDESVMSKKRVCRIENTADVAIAKVLGMRLKLETELILPCGNSRPGELYTTDENESFLIMHNKLDMKDSIKMLSSPPTPQEIRVNSMRRSAAKLIVAEKGIEINVVNINDDCTGKATTHIHKAFLKVIDELKADRQKEIRTFIELIKGEKVVKNLKIPATFIQLTPYTITVKNGAGTEDVPIEKSVILEIQKKYSDLPMSSDLKFLIHQDMVNKALETELDKTGATYKIGSDSLGITTVEVLPTESTIVLDGHADDLERVIAWIAKAELKVYTSTSDQPL